MSTTAEQETVQVEQPEVQTEAPQQTRSLVTLPPDDGATGSIEVFASHEKFRSAARMATALSQSTVVPRDYRGNVPNCLVAMELAARTGASVLMVMQNLYLIEGKPGWSAAFLVASVNTSGRFSQIRYEIAGGDDPTKDTYKVRAYAKDLSTGDTLHGEWITWAIVKGEGWLNKKGSKWATMPGQMFRYRAASFWARAFAPEISLGMRTAEELGDITETNGQSSGTQSLNDALRAQRQNETVVEAEVVTEPPKRAPTAAEIEAEIRRDDLALTQEESRKKK